MEVNDIRSVLQMHTTYTDGQNTLEEMVRACAARGYAYVAITDHTQAVRVAGGLVVNTDAHRVAELDCLRYASIGRVAAGAKRTTWPTRVRFRRCESCCGRKTAQYTTVMRSSTCETPGADQTARSAA